MTMSRTFLTAVFIFSILFSSIAQNIEWQGRVFEISHVKAMIVELEGEKVLKLERDLKSLPFDPDNLSKTVDEPTYIKVKDLDIKNGVFEVKMLSRIQIPSTFKGSQGFIGAAFRAKGDNSAYESIYLRPNVGRSDNQFARNHTVQYYAYPDHKFDRLREESNGEYETYADIGLDEWITFKVEFKGKEARLYLNDQEHASFIVNVMKGSSESGSIALWVDIGTVGYFKDLKIMKYE